MDPAAELGGIDIYLLDQVLRGRVPPGTRILDAGCGSGRNISWFLRAGYDVSGLDPDPDRVAGVRAFAAGLGVPDVELRFRAEALEETTFPDEAFDLVICNAVLHFARDRAHFRDMAGRLFRLLRPGGTCFTRLASTIGIERLVRPVSGAPEGWWALPDGTERFLVDLDDVLAVTGALGAELADPVKTVNVQDRRCMTTWVWRRPSGP